MSGKRGSSSKFAHTGRGNRSHWNWSGSSTRSGSATYTCSPDGLGTCPLPHPRASTSVHEGCLCPENPAPRAGRERHLVRSYSLREEKETVDWPHQEIQGGAKLPMVEADAVVRSLSIAMHAEQAMVLPLLELKEFDQYTTTHSMNVSVLAMALGEHLELGGATVRALGVAGLLHDLGKTCIPRDILIKPGKLSEAERSVVRDPPVVGARMLLA